MVAGTIRDRLNITPTEISLNEDSQDIDFRIETNDNSKMFFVDGGNDAVIFNGNTSDYEASSQMVQVHNSGIHFSSGYGIQGGVNADRAQIALTSGSSGHIVFKANNSEVARFTTGGLAIGGTGAANTLDDYEEGTWTVELATGFSSSNGYQTREARYTKIGRMVYCQISFRTQTSGWTANGSALTLSGLPFTTLNSECRAGGCSSFSSMPVLGSGANTIQFYGNNNATTVQMYVDGDTALAVNNGVNISGKYIIGQFFYEIA